LLQACAKKNLSLSPNYITYYKFGSLGFLEAQVYLQILWLTYHQEWWFNCPGKFLSGQSMREFEFPQ
jgi:hypothetical protein